MKKFLPFFLIFLAQFSYGQVNIALRSNLKFPGKQLSNIWGYTDSIGGEYALVGESTGLTIVNITNPDSVYEIFQIPGVNSIWREVKTWKGFAYVTSESGGGLKIIDLQNINKDSIRFKTWKPFIPNDSVNFNLNDSLENIHALHIEDGFAYLYGSNVGEGGAVFADLSDPWNPTVAGVYNENYIHDGYVRGDTLFGGHIYDGWFSIIDVSNKKKPKALATNNTPGNFSHNTWLSDNGKFLFTTDEVDYSYLTVYDITDITDIKEMDRIQITPGSGSVVHNTHVLNDFAVTSWYKDGVVIVDGHRPENLIVTGHYDSSPLSGGGMDGDWGVYPYFPSGNMVVSDMQEGLFVLTPTYTRACYLEGEITDSISGNPLFDVLVKINLDSSSTEQSSILGKYGTGSATPGTYSVTFSKPGYFSKTIPGQVLSAGNVTILNVQLVKDAVYSLSGSILDTIANTGLSGVNLILYNDNFQYTSISDNSGNFSLVDIFAGDYQLVYGKWGYQTDCQEITLNQISTINIKLKKGYYDDFTFDYGWTVSGNAPRGKWVRAEPIATFDPLNNNAIANPGMDSPDDCGNTAFVTGNKEGSVYDQDVDEGSTILYSPYFNLTTYENPVILYHRWFYNSEGTISTNPNDSMVISIEGGINPVRIDTLLPGREDSVWNEKKVVVKDFIMPGAVMRMKIKIEDRNSGHVLEGGIDYFRIVESSALESHFSGTETIEIFPNPVVNNLYIRLNSQSPGIVFELIDITGRLIHRRALRSGVNSIEFNSGNVSGLYFAIIKSDTKIFKQVKIVVQ